MNEDEKSNQRQAEPDSDVLLARLDEIGGALTRASERDDFESRWARTLLIEALHSNVEALRRLR